MKRMMISLIMLYLAGYAVLRIANAEVWDQNGHTYVVFPANPIVLYYAYRPLMYLDSTLTGMRFHVGPHRKATATKRYRR